MIESLKISFSYLHSVFENCLLQLSISLVFNHFTMLFMFGPVLVSMLDGTIFGLFTIAAKIHCLTITDLASLTL
jgi:hypothetical protein